MGLDELIGKIFEVGEEGEKFLVKGMGHLFASTIKKENASLDTNYGTVVGTVLLDFDGTLGLVGHDKAGAEKVLAYLNGSWRGATLSLRDPRMNPVILMLGKDGFETKELAVAERKMSKESKIGGKDTVIVRNNENNQRLRSELIGKLGHVIKEYHASSGLRVDISVDEQIHNLDWRDVKRRD